MRQPKSTRREVPPEEQLGNELGEVLEAVIKKTTEELGHKFNKQQSIANPTLGKQFLEEVISLSTFASLPSLLFDFISAPYRNQ